MNNTESTGEPATSESLAEKYGIKPGQKWYGGPDRGLLVEDVEFYAHCGDVLVTPFNPLPGFEGNPIRMDAFKLWSKYNLGEYVDRRTLTS